MKINKLTMRYEAHQGSVVELSPGLTVLCGDNDIGKSALSRSLKWLVTDRPLGTEMIPWVGEKAAEVTAEADRGCVTRSKAWSEEKSKYKNDLINEPSEVLNLDETNIQAQVDQYFLLTASPGVVAKRINEAAGIAESDAAIKYTNELIGEAKKEAKVLNENIKGYKAYLATHEKMIEAAGRLFDRIITIEKDITEATSSLTSAKSLSEQIKASALALADFPDYDHISDRIGGVDELERQIEKRHEFIRNAGSLSSQIHGVDLDRFGVLDQVDLGTLEELDKDIKSLSIRDINMISLSLGIKSINLDIYTEIDECTDKLSQLEALDSDLTDDIKALHEAKRVSFFIHQYDCEKFSVLEQVDLGRIEELDKDVIRLNGLRDLLVQARESKRKLVTQEQELDSMFNELTELGLVCKECGQLIEEV